MRCEVNAGGRIGARRVRARINRLRNLLVLLRTFPICPSNCCAAPGDECSRHHLPLLCAHCFSDRWKSCFFHLPKEKFYVQIGARMLPEFRGRGIFKRLQQAVTEFMWREYPRACPIRFTSYDQIPSMTKLVELDILSSYGKQNTLRSQYLSTLFPHNVLILDFFPIEPLRSNIDYFQQERDLYFAVEKCTDGSLPRSVSCGALAPTVKIVYWNVTVYTSDPAWYEAHLLHQLKRACEAIKGDFIFASYHDKSLTNHGRRVLEKRQHLEVDEKVSNQTLTLNESENLQRFSSA